MKHQDCYAVHRFPPSKNCVFVYYTATTPFCCKFFNKKYFWELEYMCNKALKFYFDPSHTTREKNSQRKLSFSARLGDVTPQLRSHVMHFWNLLNFQDLLFSKKHIVCEILSWIRILKVLLNRSLFRWWHPRLIQVSFRESHFLMCTVGAAIIRTLIRAMLPLRQHRCARVHCLDERLPSSLPNGTFFLDFFTQLGQ